MKKLTLTICLITLSGCITTESCTKTNILGVQIEIGCDEIVMQPITRSEELERTRTQNLQPEFEK